MNSLVTGLGRQGAEVSPGTLAEDCAQAGTVLARHAVIDSGTGQLTAADGGGPRRLVISSDFYAV